MPADTKGSSVIQLDWTDEGGSVTVTPRDKDRYVVKVRAAIESLQRGEHVEAIQEKVNLLQRELATWLRGRHDILKAYITLRDGGFLFLVVTNHAEYSETFEDELTDLDITLANDRDLSGLSVDVLALPNASPVAIATFIDPGFAVQYATSDGGDAA